MSNSVQPHRRQPMRLRHPWDSPGKKTGVGCHFLLQCVKVKSESEVAQWCPTGSDPVDCSLPGSFIHGIFQARVLERGAIAFSRGINGCHLKNVQTINAGENVEKREPSYTVTGNINWYRSPLWKTVWRFLKKLKTRASTWSSNPGHISRENRNLKRYMNHYTHSTIYNSWDMETA